MATTATTPEKERAYIQKVETPFATYWELIWFGTRLKFATAKAARRAFRKLVERSKSENTEAA